MRTAALALFLTLLCAPAAQAGAWLRAEGSSFNASSVSINRNQESFTSAYLEYGLSERMTLGADIGYGFDLTGSRKARASCSCACRWHPQTGRINGRCIWGLAHVI